jgi:CheY-like chemotaxis protein
MKSPFRILVIDDSEPVLAKTKSALMSAGFEATTTTSQVSSIRLLSANPFDLVIIDFHMPGLNGGQVVYALKKGASISGSKVLFYLYTSDTKVMAQAQALGFDGCLVNKGDDQSLIKQIKAVERSMTLQKMLPKVVP